MNLVIFKSLIHAEWAVNAKRMNETHLFSFSFPESLFRFQSLTCLRIIVFVFVYRFFYRL
jgi:hypothetical protein